MVQADRIKTVAIVGCTAVGKSEAAIKLAQRFNGSIIGADSMQIYRGFDIGTGKLKKSEMCGVEHCLIDVAEGDNEFSVGEYTELARKQIERVHGEGRLPIVVGGTGLYVYALFSGCNFADAPKNDGVRNSLKLASHFFGSGTLHGLLNKVDRESAGKISANDCKRTVRALEIYALTGSPKSDAVSKEKPYDDLTIVLTLPRELLYERINARVKKMFDDGMYEEAMRLIKYKKCGSFQALGYKQIAENPDMPRDELIELVAKKTRNYAKRQITYFNNVKLNKVFIDARDSKGLESCVKEFISKQ